MTAARIRPEVAALLTDFDHERSDLIRRPWRLVDLGGKPYSPAEAALVNTATMAELFAAQRLAAATRDHNTRKRDDLARVMELLSTVPRISQAVPAEASK
jgi:hypothetical protein